MTGGRRSRRDRGGNRGGGEPGDRCPAGRCHRIIRAGWSTPWLSTAWTWPTSTPVTPRLLCGQSQRPRKQFHPRERPQRGVIRGSLTHSRSPITPIPPQPAGCRTGPGSSPLPAGLLLACRPRMEPEPLRLRPRASHPAVTRDARRGGDRLAHRPEYYTFDIGRTSKRCLPLVSCTVTSHITRRSLRVRGGPARVMRRPTPTSRPDPLAQRLGQPGHVRQIGQQPRPACDAPPRPSVVTVIFGRLVVGCTCEVPLQLVFLVPQQDQNPRQDKHFRAFTARVAPLDQAAAANSRASSPA